MENGSHFFCNKACEYFPCHEVEKVDEFNCLFCYCPLYALGENCGGNFKYTSKGVKNCTYCTVPHSPDSYLHIKKHFKELAALAAKKEE